MTTTIETFLADIRYFSALDPYNWQVDNRPLSDLEESINTLASGLESSINSSKLNSLVAGLIHQTIVGRGKATGYAHQPSNMVWRLERSLTNGWITDDGKEVATIAVQVSPQEFTFSAPSSGQKKLITISSEYIVPNDSDLPYYDGTQILETEVTGFNSLVCKVGSATFKVQTSTVALANPDNYPPTSPGQIPLFHIRIDAGDTTLNKVYFQNFTQEGQSIQYATTTYQGQVRFANSQEVIDRSTTTVVSPSTSASVAIDEMANIGLGNGLEALSKDRFFLGPSDDIDSIHTIPGSLMPWLGKRAWFTGTTLGTLPFRSALTGSPVGGIIEGEITSITELSPGSGVYVVLSARQMATSFDGKLIATRTYQNPNWNSWTIFGSRAGDELLNFSVAPATQPHHAVRLSQLPVSVSQFADSLSTIHSNNVGYIRYSNGYTELWGTMNPGGTVSDLYPFTFDSIYHFSLTPIYDNTVPGGGAATVQLKGYPNTTGFAVVSSIEQEGSDVFYSNSSAHIMWKVTGKRLVAIP